MSLVRDKFGVYIPCVTIYEMTGDTSTEGSLPKDKLGGLRLAPTEEHLNSLHTSELRLAA